jgi:hypothetical protein
MRSLALIQTTLSLKPYARKINMVLVLHDGDFREKVSSSQTYGTSKSADALKISTASGPPTSTKKTRFKRTPGLRRN